MTQDQYDQLTEFYKLYHSLGGNGQAKEYYEKTMELEIRSEQKKWGTHLSSPSFFKLLKIELVIFIISQPYVAIKSASNSSCSIDNSIP